jgi:hypothetical protein
MLWDCPRHLFATGGRAEWFEWFVVGEDVFTSHPSEQPPEINKVSA